jgi:hypothetical protein
VRAGTPGGRLGRSARVEAGARRVGVGRGTAHGWRPWHGGREGRRRLGRGGQVQWRPGRGVRTKVRAWQAVCVGLSDLSENGGMSRGPATAWG